MAQLRTSQPATAFQESSYRWVIVTMTAVTGFVGVGFPTSSLPVLFSEIAESLNLDLVQIGFIWGAVAFMGVFTVLLGGPFIDYVGTRRSMIIICVAIGITGLLRSFATDFWSLFAYSFLFGVVQAVLPVCLLRLNLLWFAPRQLGFASGVMSAGFAVGLLVGASTTATILSPALGGWRNVLLVTGLLAVVVGVLWAVIHPRIDNQNNGQNLSTLVQQMKTASRVRSLWILGFVGFGIVGLMRGMVGYVPSYLRTIGWSGDSADAALSAFFLASLIGVVPLAILSDKLNSRRTALGLTASLITAGTLLMYFANGESFRVFAAMALAGVAFDGFMAIHNASVSEVGGMSAAMTGTSIGFGLMIRNAGGTIGPPAGNSLSEASVNLPFLVWAGFGLLALVMIYLYQERRPGSG